MRHVKKRANVRGKQPLVVILIPNWNGSKTKYKNTPILEGCIRSLRAKTDYKNYKILISDDSSPDDSIMFARKAFPDVELIVNRPNGGFANNLNYAMRFALKTYDPDYILLLNEDTITVQKSWLSKLVSTAEMRKDIGIVCCKTIYPDGRIQWGCSTATKGEKDSKKAQVVAEINFPGSPYSAVMLLKRTLVDKIGLLDERFLSGWEDSDYSIRARDMGFKSYFNGYSKIVHLEGAMSTLASPAGARKRMYRDMISYLRYMDKYKTRYNLHDKVISTGAMVFSTVVTTNISADSKWHMANLGGSKYPISRISGLMKAIFDYYIGGLNKYDEQLYRQKISV